MRIDFSNQINELLKELAEHDATINLNNCPHCCTTGDNYGDSCRHCGIQLKGYGHGAQFRNCIHDFIKNFYGDDSDLLVCRFCELTAEPPAPIEIDEKVLM